MELVSLQLRRLGFVARRWIAGGVCAAVASSLPVTGRADVDQDSRALASGLVEIAALVNDLDADDYAARQRASRLLLRTGLRGIEPLRKAAERGSLEQATRAVDVLRRLHRSAATDVGRAAEQALEALVESARASVARRAADALDANALSRWQADPHVIAAAHWSEVRSEATHQIARSQMELRDTMEQLRRLSADGLPAHDDDPLVEQLQSSLRRLGNARMNQSRAAVWKPLHPVLPPGAE